MTQRTVLWWGRFDPDYSRNRILRQALTDLGWTLRDYRPCLSPLGRWEAEARRQAVVDLVWVPCFRQRDLSAAHAWCRSRSIPLVADPLISAYDKQVFEREKFPPGSRWAAHLLAWERRRLILADRVLADTDLHAAFFREVLGLSGERIRVVPVGAEDSLFRPEPAPSRSPGEPLEVLFFGSFVPLQGTRTIVEAARCYRGPAVCWRLVGDGALLAECKELAAGLASVSFEEWLPYPELPARIGRADLLLGIFGTTPKAGRVIPNKVYQAAACARPVVTMASPAYPAALLAGADTGFTWVPPGDPQALAAAIAALAAAPQRLPELGRQARASYETYFSVASIRRQLAEALAGLVPGAAKG